MKRSIFLAVVVLFALLALPLAAAEDTAVDDKTVVNDEIAVDEGTTVDDETAAEDDTAVDDETAVEDDTAVDDETAVEDDTAVDDETAVEDETAVDDETAAEDETAVDDETAVEDEAVVDDETAVDEVTDYLMKADEFMVGLPENGFYLMPMQDLIEAFESGDEDLVILDIRATEKYDAGHIEGSMNIPEPMLVEKMDMVPADKKVAIVGQMDSNSAFAVSVLRIFGDRDAWVVQGGVPAWAEEMSLVTTEVDEETEVTEEITEDLEAVEEAEEVEGDAEDTEQNSEIA